MATIKGFEEWNVYVCAQPSQSSVYSMISMLQAQGDNALDVIWVNLREEPSIYMNGQPFVLRHEESPFKNLFLREKVVTR